MTAPLHILRGGVDFADRAPRLPSRGRERWRFLAEATASFLDASDTDDAIAALLRVAVPQLADLCVVRLRGEADTDRTRVMFARPEILATLGKMSPRERGEPTAAGKLHLGRATTIGEATLSVLDDAALKTIATDELHLARLRALAPATAIAVPIRHGSQPMLGVAYFVTTKASNRRYTHVEALLACDLVRRFAAAIVRLRQIEAMRKTIDETRVAMKGVIHDLKDPVATIQTALTDILEFPSALLSLSARADRNVRRALHTADRMQRVIESALPDASSDESRGAGVRPAILLSNLIDEYRVLARRRGVALRLALTMKLPVLHVDANALCRVLGNLIGNAIKFTPRGGRVTITAATSKGTLDIVVNDTGPGIQPHQASRVFASGWRGQTNMPGDGLGLAVARELSHMLGGELTCEAGERVGARFRLTLPLR